MRKGKEDTQAQSDLPSTTPPGDETYIMTWIEHDGTQMDHFFHRNSV